MPLLPSHLPPDATPALSGFTLEPPLGSSPGVQDLTSVAKDLGGVALRLVETIIKKLPDIADENPVKVAFGFARLILEIKEVGHKRS